MPTFVTAELDSGVLDETLSEHIGKGMVFFIECEDRCIGSSYWKSGGRNRYRERDVRVSIASVIFFSPSPSKKSSNLLYLSAYNTSIWNFVAYLSGAFISA